jgi:hypothetical protein
MIMPLSGLWSLASSKNLARSVSLSFALWNMVAYADIAVELAKRLMIGFMS